LSILVLCLDTSESMTYGEPWKINQAFTVTEKTMQNLRQDRRVGLVTFDATTEVLLAPQPLKKETIGVVLGKIAPRGVSCIAAGLSIAVNLIEKNGKPGDVLLLTDGRPNLSLNHMGGFEGSIDLEKELLKISREASQKHITVHSVAVGEDAFTETMSEIAEITNGSYHLAEDYVGLGMGKKPSSNALRRCMLNVHSAPVELPSAQPTWTKESEFMHVAVVSRSLHKIYLGHRRAFLINLDKEREARTALISIESDKLAGYRERNPKTAERVKTGKAILLDKSYRDYLNLGKGDSVELSIC
jgi:hypothetical protein